MQSTTGKSEAKPRFPSFTRWLVLGIVLLLVGFVLWTFGEALSLDALAERESSLRQWQSNSPLLAASMALLVYIMVAGLSLPGAAALTLFCGWFFGLWWGLLIVSLGSTAGATVAFLLSRYLLGNWVQSKMESRLAGINAAFEREGAFYLFTLRLVPLVPFFVINAVMGLTKIRATTFWWVSQLGMLPGTIAYVYAGSTVPSLKALADEGVAGILSPQLLIAFAILGILPLAIKKLLQQFGARASQELK